ncbi:1-deoxy-D-xylulose-5-phosphate synthase [Ligilactobacillus saerimneri]|uniref:1-deoxy-D-xylulose-5-phosphate synthase n=1 Tax=Ligilactobacillus saerimneri TaxID=228229 RepID=UPI0024B13197|nr:1-deoxy-D-xylulose-5-phosphate synthase [Ligilactobacillus saerimneri]MDI9206880.1 1-deoxy-D-xylulose-5-phosphate synthase [Ligilactobacillus saerimneri]
MNQHPDYLLNKITGPADVKQLTLEEMEQLATEIRQLVVEKDAAIGGHVGPNLGVAEATIAYHYVFNSPVDKIVWDISHQAYGHKMLTGRAQAFLDPDQYQTVTGYTNPQESPHDYYAIGHTGTSVALAIGMAKARDMQGRKENILAFIGDGSMSGGLAFEAFNNAAKLHSNLIIVVNDNQMSIDENQGGLYISLAELRATNGQTPNNPFTAMGLDYKYVADGNDLAAMIAAFEEVKDVDHPVVLHINTLKGKGYQPAIDHQMAFHWHGPFDVATGTSTGAANVEKYADLARQTVAEQINAGLPVLALNAAIPGAFGLKDFQAKYPGNYDDVGIAEQFSITYATGLAQNGVRPIVFENSTFLQRAYDQLVHDMALNNQPVVLYISNGTITSGSKTHQGGFDIPYLSNIPNVEYLAPTNAEELQAMLKWALQQTDRPVAIRQPGQAVVHGVATQTDYSKIKYAVDAGEKVAILALGGFYELGRAVQTLLTDQLGFKPTLINPLSATTLDEATLTALRTNHTVVVTLEDGEVNGGWGQKVVSFYGPTSMRVKNYGAAREFNDSVPMVELKQRYHLTPELIVNDIATLLKD